MSGVPIDAVIRHRLPPSSRPSARPGTRTGYVSSASTAATVTGSALVSAACSDSAERSGVRSSRHAAPGPCTPASRAPRQSANCNAVMSENPATTFGSRRTAAMSIRSTTRCAP